MGERALIVRREPVGSPGLSISAPIFLDTLGACPLVWGEGIPESPAGAVPAQAGERDPKRLCEGAVQALSPADHRDSAAVQ